MMSAPFLRIHHLPGTTPPAFEAQRLDGKRTPQACIASPDGFLIAGMTGSDLRHELRWYLENFLDMPFPPETDRADLVRASLKAWGKQAFGALFGTKEGVRLLDQAKREGYDKLHIEIRSDDPSILGWPWEALYDEEAGFLAHTCRMERRLNNVADPPPLAELPKSVVNILLVIARPFEGDVEYRSIARSLVELVGKKNLPARVHVLRPPTFERLREHLREQPNFYHIVHFDGHGAYANAPSTISSFTFASAEGQLVFEDERGDPAPVHATTLSALLLEHRIPAVVLNACRSAMIDERASDPFASVSAAFLKAGVRSVVAMAYSLYVSGAQEFLPAFYERLFQSGLMAEASRAGRQAMLLRKGRVCDRGRFDLDDWLVPVLYEANAERLHFDVAFAAPVSRKVVLPDGAREEDNPYGFVGRDGPLLELERAMRGPAPAIVIQGMGGIGKTTLARGFVEWLAQTEGLGKGCIWVSFREVRSAEAVLNRMGEPLFGENFGARPLEQKLEAITEELRKHSFVIVWDNFEDVTGARGRPATMSETERALLRRFLKKLDRGRTKVLITSRDEAAWLGDVRRKVVLKGLKGEERAAYCDAIADRLGLKINREDAAFKDLLGMLAGHPLAMRVVLPKLEQKTAAELVETLRKNFAKLDEEMGDEATRQLYATLRLAEEVVPSELKPLLLPLGMHEGYVDGGLLYAMANQVDGGWSKALIAIFLSGIFVRDSPNHAGWSEERIAMFLGLLANAGLMREVGNNVFEMHPVLCGYLRAVAPKRAVEEERDRWTRGFVEVMGRLAERLAPAALHEQRVPFFLFGASLSHAQDEAERLGMVRDQASLLQLLGAYSLNTRDFAEAEALLERLAETFGALANAEGQAIAYHQLGIVAIRRRDFDAAEAWCMRSLAITENLNIESGAARTYHQLGRIAEERRDFDAADAWYKKSLTIKEKLGDDHDAAGTYNQLGIVAEKRRDLDAADAWYKKSLTIKEKLGDAHGAASTYHHLGTVAEKRGNFEAAEACFKKSLTIDKKLGNERGAASTYHHLGIVSQMRRDFEAAEAWYKKSLTIKENLGDAHGAAITYGGLGSLAGDRQQWEHSARWLMKSIAAFLATNDPHNAHVHASNFRVFYRLAPATERPKMRAIWNQAGIQALPPDAEILAERNKTE